MKTIEERFWIKVDRSGGPSACWPWTAYRKPTGYGVFRLLDTTIAAHRVAYELTIGPIPEGLTIDHLCRNKACQNPTHMEPIPHPENARRRHLADPDLCAKGLHQWSDPQVLTLHHGRRECRPCRNATAIATYRRNRSLRSLNDSGGS